MKRIFRLSMRSLLVLLLLPVVGLAYSQITITGTVTSATDNNSLPGVNVVVKGTTTGAITDLDGNYSIEVPNAEAILQFSYIGFLAEEVAVGSQTVVDVALVEDITALDEIVVIGYGTRKKSEITGAVASVNENYIENSTSSDPAVALQGSVAGVTVTQSGTPGGDAEILIRGLGTINGNKPLIIVDGIYGARMPAQSQIENVQVLKDAASSAIYGSQGANGVILVTTLQGKKGKAAEVNFSVRTGVNYVTEKHDIMIDPVKYQEMKNLENGRWTEDPIEIPTYLFPAGAEEGDPGTDISEYDYWTHPITKTNQAGTDWLDEMYQKGIIQDYNLSLTGGSDNARYSFAANYMDKEGLLKYTGFNRMSFRANADIDINKWLTIGERISFSRRDVRGSAGNNTNEGIFKDAFELSPLLPVYNEGGDFAGNRSTNEGVRPSPVANLYYSSFGKNRSYATLGNAYAQINILDGLKFKTLFGFNYGTNMQYRPSFPRPDFSNGDEISKLTEVRSSNIRWNWTNTLNYTKTFGSHKFDVLIGTEAYDIEWEGIEAGRDNFYSDEVDYLVLDAGEENITNEGYRGGESYFSIFGRAYYSYAEKYMLEYSLRHDKSSKFGPESPEGNFHAFSLGWNLSNESFLAGTESWLDNLKLRYSWGQAGNNQMGPYNAYTTYATHLGYTDYSLSGSDNSVVSGLSRNSIGDPFVQWETVVTSNLGVDATLIRSLTLSVELWNKKSQNMLYPMNQPSVLVGTSSLPSVNIGEMENKGIDIVIGYKGNALNQELRYFVNGTFSMYRNEVTKLSGNEDEFIDGRDGRSQIYTRTETGRSFPEFYGYVVDGIFQTEEEADAWPENGSYNAPGKLRFVDINGDTAITADDRTYIGSPHPDWTAGLNLGLEYKGVDFSVTFYASVGNEIVNYGKRFRDYGFSEGPRSPERLTSSWGSPYLNGNNEAATLPSVEATSNPVEQRASNLYIEDGSFLRMQNIQLGYNLPQSLLEKISVKKLRIYVMANNLWTVTGYTGLNPEVTLRAGERPDGTWGTMEIDRGVDISNWPVPKEVLIGLNLTF